MNELDLVDLVRGDTIHLNPLGTVYLALTFQVDELWLIMMSMMIMITMMMMMMIMSEEYYTF